MKIPFVEEFFSMVVGYFEQWYEQGYLILVIIALIGLFLYIIFLR